MAEQGYSRRNKRPRVPTEAERAKLEEFIESIHYSERRVHPYCDNENEYRHVHIPKAMLKAIPKDYFDPEKGTLKLLWEAEWRGLGITQSLGWEHYEVHEPEPHILLFKRPIDYIPPQPPQ
ncbi:MAG: Cyclin-dependent kinases regulatory subunit (Cell division control protein cks1) [Geoglossum umbratile]|nr:MAG: Cyclin-dependent kinases regulatory subunit (Cell division control protein cks1) [Geoglossum umbratile]